MFKELWNYRLASQKTQSKSLQLEINKTERKIEQLLDRIVEAESTAIVSAYEKRIGELQLEKQIMQEKVASCGRPLKDFDESFRTAETTLPFKALGHFSGGENKMAHSGGCRERLLQSTALRERNAWQLC